MQYSLMSYQTDAQFASRTDPARREANGAAFGRYVGALQQAGILVTTLGIEPPTTAAAVRGAADTRRAGRMSGQHPHSLGTMETTTMTTMTTPNTGTREQWLAARLELLDAEKELTRRGDELARKRQALPWVPVEKDYRFDTDDGRASLADLFRGRSQLIVYHFMFGPDYAAGCPSCSSIADGFNGIAVHLENHDVSLCAVSRAPLDKLTAYKQRMGWTFPWASSFGGDFNFDFSVAFTELEQRSGDIEYNYRREAAMPEEIIRRTLPEWKQMGSEAPVGQIAASAGVDVATFLRERPGMSAFALRDGVVYHTYSTFARGLDGLWGMYQWLDRAPLGRNERGVWLRHRDRYNAR